MQHSRVIQWEAWSLSSRQSSLVFPHSSFQLFSKGSQLELGSATKLLSACSLDSSAYGLGSGRYLKGKADMRVDPLYLSPPIPQGSGSLPVAALLGQSSN